MGMYEEAISILQKAVDLSECNPLALSGLGHVYAASGNRDEAHSILTNLKQLARERYVSHYNIAIVHAGLGEKEAALDWLVKAYHHRDVWVVWFQDHTQVHHLRSTARLSIPL